MIQQHRDNAQNNDGSDHQGHLEEVRVQTERIAYRYGGGGAEARREYLLKIGDERKGLVCYTDSNTTLIKLLNGNLQSIKRR